MVKRLTQLRRTLHSPLARRLIVGLALFSTAVTLVLTSIQLRREYREDIDEIETRLQAVRHVHLASLTQSVWTTNQKDVVLLLNGIVGESYIEYAAVLDGDRITAEAGKRLSTKAKERRYPLVYSHLDRPYQVGTLVVIAGLDPIDRQLKASAFIILANTAATMFLLAVFAFVLLHLLLTRHLLTAAEYVHDLDLNKPAAPLRLLRRTRAKPDELDGLVDAINNMQLHNRAVLAELREREARIRLLLDSTEEGIYGVDSNGLCTFVNPAGLRMLGYEREDEVLGKNMHRLIHHSHPDGSAYPQETCRVRLSAVQGQPAHASDEVHWRRDGSSFPVEYWAHPMQHDGKLMGAVVTFMDISERKRAEAALHRTQFSLDHAPDGVFWLDAEGNVTYANEQGARLLGYAREEMPGMPIWNFDTDFPPEAWPKLWRQLHDGKVRTYETRHLDKDGVLHPVEISAIQVRYDGETLHTAFVRDISERKRAEAELRRHREHLEEMVESRTADLRAVNQELESFAYSVSHDLRAPLRGIDGFSQALLEDYADRLDPIGQDYLGRVRAGAQRMSQLIDDLLALSRITRAPLQPLPVDLSTLAEQVLAQLRDAHPERQVDVQIQPDLQAKGDPGLLRVLLENLLGNAWKYSARQARARIEFGRQTKGDETVYFVRDNGAGFDMQYVDKLFGAFQRLHRHDEFEGTGIGLATAQRIVHRHGGRVWAEGAPEQGATFYFTLGA